MDKLSNVIPIFKKGKVEDLRKHWPVNLISIPGKEMEQGILEVIKKHRDENKVNRSS